MKDIIQERVDKGLCPLCNVPIKKEDKIAMIEHMGKGVRVHSKHIPIKAQDNILGSLGEKKN